MKCEEVQSLQDAYLDSELDAKSTLEIQQHLTACADCARAFAAEAKLEARVTASLKRGQRTSSLWEQIERRVVLAAESNRPGQAAALAPPPIAWWRQLLWPSPQAWAGLAALWVMMLAVSLSTREPATVTQAQQVTRPSPQLRQMLREQKQMLAELGGVAEPLGVERPGRVAPPPRSQIREQLSNT